MRVITIEIDVLNCRVHLLLITDDHIKSGCSDTILYCQWNINFNNFAFLFNFYARWFLNNLNVLYNVKSTLTILYNTYWAYIERIFRKLIWIWDFSVVVILTPFSWNKKNSYIFFDDILLVFIDVTVKGVVGNFYKIARYFVDACTMQYFCRRNILFCRFQFFCIHYYSTSVQIRQIIQRICFKITVTKSTIELK